LLQYGSALVTSTLRLPSYQYQCDKVECEKQHKVEKWEKKQKKAKKNKKM
jgi:hypothetical protein